VGVNVADPTMFPADSTSLNVGGNSGSGGQQVSTIPAPAAKPTSQPQADPLSVAIDKNIQSMLSGDWTQGLTTSMNEQTARGIANTRAGAAQQAANAGVLDQGVGYQAAQGVEQSALQQTSANALAVGQAEQAAKDQGVQLGQTEQGIQNTKDLNDYNAFMANGDFANAATVLTRMSGQTPDMAPVKAQYADMIKGQNSTDLLKAISLNMDLVSSGLLDSGTAAALGAATAGAVFSANQQYVQGNVSPSTWSAISTAFSNVTSSSTLTGHEAIVGNLATSMISTLSNDNGWNSARLSNPAFESLFEGSTANTAQVGAIAAAYTKTNPTQADQALCQKYGLSNPNWSAVVAADTSTATTISDKYAKDPAGAQELWNAQTPDFKAAHPWTDFSNNPVALNAQVSTMISSGDYTSLVGKKTDDPLYQAALNNTTIATASGSISSTNHAAHLDIPSAGQLTKIGGRLFEVKKVDYWQGPGLGWNGYNYTLVDVATGKQITANARTSNQGGASFNGESWTQGVQDYIASIGS
jgi:hypothetical protein